MSLSGPTAVTARRQKSSNREGFEDTKTQKKYEKVRDGNPKTRAIGMCFFLV